MPYTYRKYTLSSYKYAKKRIRNRSFFILKYTLVDVSQQEGLLFCPVRLQKNSGRMLVLIERGQMVLIGCLLKSPLFKVEQF